MGRALPSLLAIFSVLFGSLYCERGYSRHGEQLYSLNLEPVQAAVLQSQVQFTALLQTTSSDSSFTYTWTDTSEQYSGKPSSVQCGNLCKFKRTYNKMPNVAGTYNMTVRVWVTKGISKHPVAVATVPFVLTEFIRGKLTVTQDDRRLLLPNTFNANEQIFAEFESREVFDPQYPTSMEYRWSDGGVQQLTTRVPYWSFNVSRPGVFNVSVDAEVTVTIPSEKMVIGVAGHITQAITVKEPILTFDYRGESHAILGHAFKFSVACNASLPVSMTQCWIQTTDPSRPTNQTCLSTLFVDFCDFNVSHSFPETGLYTLNLTLQNFVSTYQAAYQISVTDQVTPEDSYVILVPTLFASLTVFIVAAAVVYVWIQGRRFKIVEVADFQFHSDIEDSPNGPDGRLARTVRKVKKKVKAVLKGVKYDNWKGRTRITFQPTTAKRYGSIDGSL